MSNVDIFMGFLIGVLISLVISLIYQIYNLNKKSDKKIVKSFKEEDDFIHKLEIELKDDKKICVTSMDDENPYNSTIKFISNSKLNSFGIDTAMVNLENSYPCKTIDHFPRRNVRYMKYTHSKKSDTLRPEFSDDDE